MKQPRNDIDLAAALRALRPSPRPEFVAALDAHAAAGFPEDGRRKGAAPQLDGLRGMLGRLRSAPPRRLLVPAGATAVAAIVVATALVAVEDGAPKPAGSGELHFGSGDTPASRLDATEALSPRGSAARESAAGGASAASGSGGGAQYSDAAPTLGRLAAPPAVPGYASRASRREVERSAELVIGTDPAEVRSAAAAVFDAVHAADGIVLRSSIRDGAAGAAGADFHLLIPSRNAGDALAALSAIGEVRSRRESTQDITAPTIGVGERLRDSRAMVESLLAQLAQATTDSERTAVEAELRVERRRVATLRSHLATFRRRANFSHLWLRIETGAAEAAGDRDASWGVGEALDDAGRILAVAAGVTLIGFAILAPIAMLCLLAWLARRRWVRIARERALS